jgi:hypothetical protein
VKRGVRFIDMAHDGSEILAHRSGRQPATRFSKAATSAAMAEFRRSWQDARRRPLAASIGPAGSAVSSCLRWWSVHHRRARRGGTSCGPCQGYDYLGPPKGLDERGLSALPFVFEDSARGLLPPQSRRPNRSARRREPEGHDDSFEVATY